MVDGIVKGDLVSVPSLYPGRVGSASHSDKMGRWVVWRDRGGHWAAGAYEPSEIVLVGPPEPKQIRLPI